MWAGGEEWHEFVFHYNKWSPGLRFSFMEVWFLGPESGQVVMILISLLWFFAGMKKQEQAEKSLQPVGQKNLRQKWVILFTRHALTCELWFCLAFQEMYLTCAEQLIPAQTISTLHRRLAFAQSAVWPLWKCTHNNTWFLVQSHLWWAGSGSYGSDQFIRQGQRPHQKSWLHFYILDVFFSLTGGKVSCSPHDTLAFR